MEPQGGWIDPKSFWDVYSVKLLHKCHGFYENNKIDFMVMMHLRT